MNSKLADALVAFAKVMDENWKLEDFEANRPAIQDAVDAVKEHLPRERDDLLLLLFNAGAVATELRCSEPSL
jgi:hypothetical protein